MVANSFNFKVASTVSIKTHTNTHTHTYTHTHAHTHEIKGKKTLKGRGHQVEVMSVHKRIESTSDAYWQ